MLQEINIPLTTAAGALTTYSESPVFGKLYAVHFKLGTLESGAADVTISYTGSDGVSVTLLTITNAAANAIYKPRDLVHDAAGTALTGTAGGDRALPIVAGKIKVVVAQASLVQTGNVLLYVDKD